LKNHIAPQKGTKRIEQCRQSSSAFLNLDRCQIVGFCQRRTQFYGRCASLSPFVEVFKTFWDTHKAYGTFCERYEVQLLAVFVVDTDEKELTTPIEK
jgi:hypothetical protein